MYRGLGGEGVEAGSGDKRFPLQGPVGHLGSPFDQESQR
jgi:hypothetical protein